MKKTLYMLAGIVLIMTSCSKTLNKLPLDKLTEDTFFETEAGMLSFSNSFYAYLPGGSSLYLDNADNYFQMEQLLEARGGRQVPSSGGGWTWEYLRKFNTLLDNAGQCKDEAVRTKYVALARFFRAQFYFDKVKRFGDVPWIATQLGSADAQLYAPRDSRELVIQHVLEDLNYAIANLPKERTVYTVNKWTAMALKSRVCLFEGTFRKYHGITGYDHDATWYLNEAAVCSGEFIQSSGYSIYSEGKDSTNYVTLFSTVTIEGSPVAKEVIMARNYNAAYSVTHNSNYQFTTASMGKYGMSRKTVASYLKKDGTPFTDTPGWEKMEFKDEVMGRDLRLCQSIRIPGYHRLDNNTKLVTDMGCTVTGYQPIKCVTTTAYDAYNVSENDLILFRAGEVYLNYAEALAEMGKLTQADLDKSVNKLRRRVGMPDLQMGVKEDPFLTNKEWGGYQNVKADEKQRALVLEIRRERTIELNQEGFRYYDLMRWKEGKIFEQPMYGMYFPSTGEFDLDGDGKKDILIWEGETMPSSSCQFKFKVGVDIILSGGNKGMIQPFKGFPGKWDEGKDYLYPLPSGELTLNKNLTQNPGWKTK